MKSWNNYFNKTNEQVNEQVSEEKLNEDHKKSKDEQAKFICEAIGKMDDKEVTQVYKYIETMDFYKNNYVD